MGNFGKEFFLKGKYNSPIRKSDQDFGPLVAPPSIPSPLPSPVEAIPVDLAERPIGEFDLGMVKEDILTAKGYLDGVFPSAILNFKVDWYLFDFTQGTDDQFLTSLDSLDAVNLSDLYVRITMLAVQNGLPEDSLHFYKQIVFGEVEEPVPAGAAAIPETAAVAPSAASLEPILESKKEEQKDSKKLVKDQEEKKAGDPCKMDDGADGVLEEKEGKLVCVLPPKKEELKRGELKKDQEQKVGDACKLEDGSEGVLEDKEGKLVCILKKKDSKQDELKTGDGVIVTTPSGSRKSGIIKDVKSDPLGYEVEFNDGSVDDIKPSDISKKEGLIQGPPNAVECKRCGRGIPTGLTIGMSFCPYCGTQYATPGQSNTQSSSKSYPGEKQKGWDEKKLERPRKLDALEVSPIGVENGVFYVSINGKKYGYAASEMVVEKFFHLLRYNAGRALAYLKKEAELIFGAKHWLPGSAGGSSFESQDLEKLPGYYFTYMWYKDSKYYITTLHGKIVQVKDSEQFPVQIKSKFGDTEKTLYFSKAAGDLPIPVLISNLEAFHLLMERIKDEEKDYQYKLDRYFIRWEKKDGTSVIIPMLDQGEISNLEKEEVPNPSTQQNPEGGGTIATTDPIAGLGKEEVGESPNPGDTPPSNDPLNMPPQAVGGGEKPPDTPESIKDLEKDEEPNPSEQGNPEGTVTGGGEFITKDPLDEPPGKSVGKVGEDLKIPEGTKVQKS